MKKKKTIFWTTILIILPLIIIVNIIVLFSAHTHISNTTYQHYIRDIQKAAAVSDEAIGNHNLTDPETVKADNATLSEICELLDVTYIYALEIDTQKNTQKYLAIGTSKNASHKFISERYPGYVVPNVVDKHMLAALKGDKDNAVDHIVNEYGDTLICYVHRTSKDHPNELIAAEISVTEVMADLNRDFSYVAGILILFTIAVVVIFSIIIRRKVSLPAQTISQKMTHFVQERKSGFEPLELKGSKEFTDMANTFNVMAEDIDRYLNELNELNRQKAQLSIARDIQKGLLEPAEFHNKTVSINAFMLPAKFVGGDLYDYQVLPDGKICIMIADVSDKGISAALFMSRAITLLHHYAESGMQPGKILYEYNNHLAARNPNMLFITTFVGIYNPKTRNLVYANAGHNYPYIISEKLRTLNGEQGMAAGIFEGQSYPEHRVVLRPGDLLFLYTDGVSDAQNQDGALYGESRLETVLNDLIVSGKRDAIPHVLDSIKDFTKNAVQADDITMLTMYIPNKQQKKIQLKAQKENLTALYQEISQLKIPEETKTNLNCMAEEIFVNICFYAYPDDTGIAEIIIETDSNYVTMTFIDAGKPFDPTKDILQIENYDIEKQIGGLGRYITFSLADTYSYDRKDGKNILTITKKW